MPEATPEAAAPVSQATGLAWVRTGRPPGGLGYDIRYKFDDPNTWYVTDNFAGVHISTDNGLTWQPSNTGIPPQLGPTGDWLPIFCLTVDPHNPQIIWAGTDVTDHIYKSTDGGLHWEKIWDEPPPSSLARYMWIDPSDPDVLYVSTGIFDRGAVGEGDPRTDPFGGLGVLLGWALLPTSRLWHPRARMAGGWA